jgi:hypothetical protein
MERINGLVRSIDLVHRMALPTRGVEAMSLTCTCCGEVVCKHMAAATEPRALSPEAVLARYDDSEGRPQFPSMWLAEALRQALKERDALKGLQRASGMGMNLPCSHCRSVFQQWGKVQAQLAEGTKSLALESEQLGRVDRALIQAERERDELGAEALACDRRRRELEAKLASQDKELLDQYIVERDLARKAERERDEARAQLGLFQIQINALTRDADCQRKPKARRIPPETCGSSDCECCAAWSETVDELQKARAALDAWVSDFWVGCSDPNSNFEIACRRDDCIQCRLQKARTK